MKKLEENTEDIREDHRREVHIIFFNILITIILENTALSKDCELHEENCTCTH